MKSSSGDNKKIQRLGVYNRRRKGNRYRKITCKPAGEITSKSNPGKTTYSNPSTNISSHSQSSTLAHKDGEMERRHRRAEDVYNYVCILCKTNGSLLRCDTCFRTYHPHCVGLKSEPEGQWHCPKCCEEDYNLISQLST